MLASLAKRKTTPPLRESKLTHLLAPALGGESAGEDHPLVKVVVYTPVTRALRDEVTAGYTMLYITPHRSTLRDTAVTRP